MSAVRDWTFPVTSRPTKAISWMYLQQQRHRGKRSTGGVPTHARFTEGTGEDYRLIAARKVAAASAKPNTIDANQAVRKAASRGANADEKGKKPGMYFLACSLRWEEA